MAQNSDHGELTAQFAAIAGISPQEARQYLETNEWNLEAAAAEYYASREDDLADPDFVDSDDEEATTPTTSIREATGGGRRLGEGPSDPQPIPVAPSSSSRPKKKPAQRKKFATIGDVSAGADEDEDEDDKPRDLFAGGEKSGLAVQNPEDIRKKIIEKAMKRQPEPSKDSKPTSSHFTGAARTLGGDDTPSQEIPSQRPSTRPGAERVERVLHFWNDGFSIDDGDLYRSDDPSNAEILNGIRQGRAPLHIMGVMPGQEVDVEIKQHQENYVKPKKKYTPFAGSGNRLGSPTPGFPSMPGSFDAEPPRNASPAPPATASAPSNAVSDDKPTVSLRISLADGTRLTSRFNTDQTVGDVYDFVRRAGSGGREFVLQTTFPTKVLEDPTLALGEMSEFKRGGVVVQKYA